MAGSAYGWDQSDNAQRVIPNDFWYQNWFAGNVTESGTTLQSDGTEFEDYDIDGINEAGPGMWHLRDEYMNLERAWAITTGNPDLLIVINDLEVDTNHPDLIGNQWTNAIEAAGIEGVDDDGNGFIDDIHGYDIEMDDNDPTTIYGTKHGTQMIAMAAAQGNNGIGGVGIVWDCQIVSIKGLAYGTQYGYNNEPLIGQTNNLASGINSRNMAAEYAVWLKESGYDVRVFSYSAVCYPQTGVNVLDMADILFVSGAGNGNTDTFGCSTPFLNYLGLDERVLIASGVNQNGIKLQDMSGSTNEGPSFGSVVDACGYITTAGYIDYNTAYPIPARMLWASESDIAYMFLASWVYYAPGTTNFSDSGPLFWAGNFTTDPIYYNNYNWNPTYLSGDTSDLVGVKSYGIIPSDGRTSGATTQAAGLAMLVASAYPETHNQQIKGMIERGCINVDAMNVAMCNAGPCAGLLGAGRLDAYRTLTLWGTVNADTTFSGDVYVSGDIHIPDYVTVTCLPGTTFWIAPDDIYEGSIIGDGNLCQPRYIIDDTNIVAYPTNSPYLTEFYVEGVLNISSATIKSWGKVAGTNDWGGIYRQPGATVTTDGSTAVLNTTGGNI